METGVVKIQTNSLSEADILQAVQDVLLVSHHTNLTTKGISNSYEYPLLAYGVGTTHDEGSGISLELPSYQVNSEVNHLALGREGVGRITVCGV